MKTYDLELDGVLDYGWDFSTWLAGDTILTSTFVGTGIAPQSPGHSTTTTSAWFTGAGLVAGSTYKVKNTITTAGGRTTSRTFQIRAVAAKYT